MPFFSLLHITIEGFFVFREGENSKSRKFVDIVSSNMR